MLRNDLFSDDSGLIRHILLQACVANQTSFSDLTSEIRQVKTSVKTPLRFLAISLLSYIISSKLTPVSKPSSRGDVFMNAHSLMMNYIYLSCGNKTIPDALFNILPTCSDPVLRGMKDICNARYAVSKSTNTPFVRCRTLRDKCVSPILSCGLLNTQYSISKLDKDFALPDFFITLKLEDCFSVANGSVPSIEYAYNIAAYAKRMSQIHDYLQCRSCNQPLIPNPNFTKASKYYRFTMFDCNNNHCANPDKDVYINHCIRCKHVIDSRECCNRDGNGSGGGFYICMRCGGSEHLEPYKKCPRCLGTDIKFDTIYKYVSCKACGLNGQQYGIVPHK